MFVKRLSDCGEFIANDGCRISELLHPKKDSIQFPYSIAIARVDVGRQTYKHRLKQTEVYYILSGNGCIHINNEIQKVKAGDAVFISPEAV